MTERADVVIIGGGLAACAAAVEAAKYGLRVALVDKGALGRSGSSCTAGGGFSFARPADGSATLDAARARHAANTIAVGEGLNDPALVKAMVADAPIRVPELEYLGLRFPRDESGRIRAGLAPAHDEPRSASPQDGGPALMDCLRKEVFHRRVRVFERYMAARLFTSDGRVAGVYLLQTDGEDALAVQTSTVILAAGSATRLYPYASANFQTTGDAYALAWPLGARFANMEFNEFSLIPKVGRTVIATAGISTMMSAGSHLVNALGERFMPRYDPERAEMTTRAHLVQAVVLETNAERGPVWNDSMAIPPDIRERLLAEDWEIIGKLQSAGLKWPEERFEWVPATHLCLGGIVIDPNGRTDISGLFAVGESACGVHGTNRLSGNALSECLVFGIRAGRAAALQAMSAAAPEVPAEQIAAFEAELGKLQAQAGEEPSAVEQSVRQAAWAGIGVIRNERGLQQAAEAFDALSRAPLRCQSRADLIKALETRNLALTGRLVAQAALMRTESRGQHLREDYPQTLEQWQKWIVLRKDGGAIAASIEPVGLRPS